MADLESVVRRLQREEQHFRQWLDPTSVDHLLTSIRRYHQTIYNPFLQAQSQSDSVSTKLKHPWDDIPIAERLSTLSKVVELPQLQGLRDEVEGHVEVTQQLLKLCQTKYVGLYKRSGGALNSEDAERRRAVLQQYEAVRLSLRDLVGKVQWEVLEPLTDLMDRCGAQPIDLPKRRANEGQPLATSERGEELYNEVESQHLVEVSVDRELEESRRQELQQIAQDMQEVRALQEEMQRLVAQQQADVDLAEQSTEGALHHAVQSRVQLSLAAKYKVAGATLTGALVGGLVGGPVGMVAGAKSAATIALAAAAGAATGGVVVKTVVSASTARAESLDDDYDDRPHRD